MENIIQSTEMSLKFLQWIGLIIMALGLTAFVPLCQKKLIKMPTLKLLAFFATAVGTLNAGIAITFGSQAYFITPLVIGVMFILWATKKLPDVWKLKQVFMFSILFTVFSGTIFLGLTGVFFHLAIEGKI